MNPIRDAIDQAVNGSHLDAAGLNHNDDSLSMIAADIEDYSGWASNKASAHYVRLSDALKLCDQSSVVINGTTYPIPFEVKELIDQLHADSHRLDWALGVIADKNYITTDIGCGCCGDGVKFKNGETGREMIDFIIAWGKT